MGRSVFITLSNVSRVDEIPDLTSEEEEALGIYLNSIPK